jgi:putative DNA primase/helicase
MSLRAIVRALGGDLYDGGRRANIPAPGHSARDRSISLLWSNGRLIVHSFGEADWRDVRDDLRARHLIDPLVVDGAVPAPRLPLERRLAVVGRLWLAAGPIADTLGERHLRLRGIRRPLSEALRFHPSLPIAVYREGRAAGPALVARIDDPAGGLSAVEVTYLDRLGRRTTALRLSRKTVGRVPSGSAVQLDDAATAMVVAEGVATALSASERFSLPAWALLSAHNLAAWSPPPTVHDVLIAGDSGRPGELAAAALGDRLSRLGVASRAVFPRPPFGDWNEAAAGPESEGEGG